MNCKIQLPHTNYHLEFIFHGADHIAMKIIFLSEVVILPWIRKKSKYSYSSWDKSTSNIAAGNNFYNAKCLTKLNIKSRDMKRKQISKCCKYNWFECKRIITIEKCIIEFHSGNQDKFKMVKTYQYNKA